MLKPSDIENLKGNHSRYAVVIGVAKRARDIAQNAEDNDIILIEKPVTLVGMGDTISSLSLLGAR